MKLFARGALLLVVLAAGAWALALRSSPAGAGADSAAAWSGQILLYPRAESLVARRVVAEGDGRFSPFPDGTRFAYVDAAGDLAILDIMTGESRRLGEATARQGHDGGAGFVFGSRFAPDGQRIAYQLSRDGHWAIRVLDGGTGEVRELLHHPDPMGWIDLGSWSPDGQTLATALFLDGSRTSPGRIALGRVGDGSVTDIASFHTRPAASVTFSPDGGWLAYHRVRDLASDDHDIFLLSVDGSRELQLTRGPGDHRVAGWLPGGGPFFYLSGDHGRFDLMAVQLENGRAASRSYVVRSDLWHILPAGFSRSAFFYVQMPERLKPHTARIDPVAGLTSALTAIVPATAMDWTSFMTWSPNGDRSAYLAGSDLVVRSLATGAERRIPTGFSALGTGALVWSPVADRLAIQGADHAAGTVGIHLVDLADGSVELLLPSDGEVSNFQPWWSPDGQALFVGRRQFQRAGIAIVRVDLETLEEREVFRVERYAGFALHPDGRHLAVGQRGAAPGDVDRVLLVTVEAGAARELISLEATGGLSRGNAGLDWTPDGSYLVVAGNPDAEHRRTLWIVDRDGSRIRELASFVSDGGMQVRPRIHPGGREISVMAGRNRWEIWTLEHLRAEPLREAGRRR
jgi:Tol biopolymer transport system component